MTSPAGALALVESPVQLLHLLEWCHRTKPRALEVVILAPQRRLDSTQLSAVASLAEQSGLSIMWFYPRRSRTASLRTMMRLRRMVTSVETLIIGDPFSGMIQTVLSSSRAQQIIVLDDGTATIDFVQLLAAQLPLVRWAEQPSRRTRQQFRQRLAGRATDFFDPQADRLLELFTVMPVTPLDGMRVTRHRYEWTRLRFAPPQLSGAVSVVGSTLVESGILRTDAYLRAVVAATNGNGDGGRYYAHRRESPHKLRTLEHRTGLQIVTPGVPLEIELCRGPVSPRVVCFPSTPAYTLPIVLHETPVEVDVLGIKSDWLRPDAEQRATEFLKRMSAQLRVDP